MQNKCKKCSMLFEAKGTWQTYCTSCFKFVKEEELKSLKNKIFSLQTEVSFLQNKLVNMNKMGTEEFDQFFLMKLIKLCHPDRHENSKESNEVTAKLLNLRKKK